MKKDKETRGYGGVCVAKNRATKDEQQDSNVKKGGNTCVKCCEHSGVCEEERRSKVRAIREQEPTRDGQNHS